jgi:tetratricopeptide (TPR) repeat protein
VDSKKAQIPLVDLMSARAGNVKAMNKIASESMKAKDFKTAIFWYSKIIKKCDSNQNQYWQVAVNNLGNIMYRLGDIEQAKSFYKQGANAHNVTSTYNLGKIAEEQKNLRDAIYWYELALNRGHKKVGQRLNALKLELKKFETKGTPKPAQPSTNSSNYKREKPRERLLKNWEDAEKVARDWMEYFGFHDAKCNPKKGSDGGIDIHSSKAIAQVKFHGTKTPRPELERLHSAMLRTQKVGLFFSLSGYGKPAIEFANSQAIALFEFNLQGVPTPVNSYASKLAS